MKYTVTVTYEIEADSSKHIIDLLELGKEPKQIRFSKIKKLNRKG